MFVFSSLDCFGLYCWCPNLCSDVRDNQHVYGADEACIWC